VPSNDYDRALDVQQRVNLEIMRRFNEAGIGFAFPSRTVYTAGLANGAG
jgi:small-conductance mechanosensitive channel